MRKLILVILLALGAPASAAAAAPSVAIFYYPWYSSPATDGGYRHWQQNGAGAPTSIASAYYPARGPYSSANRRVVAAQMREIAGAGVDEVVVSWWGSGSLEDTRLPAVIAAARAERLEVAVHLEPYEGRSVVSVGGDVVHLRGLGIRDFYLYEPLDAPAAAWAALRPQLPADVRIFAQTSLVGFAAAAGFDGVYTYDILQHGGGSFARLCDAARRHALVCAPSVGPGYNARRATGDLRLKPRRNGATYDAMWTAALHAGPDLVTITSYNEWHEGTQIEPAQVEPAWLGYASYEGAWGLHGLLAQRAYLDRTAYWAALFRATR